MGAWAKHRQERGRGNANLVCSAPFGNGRFMHERPRPRSGGTGVIFSCSAVSAIVGSRAGEPSQVTRVFEGGGLITIVVALPASKRGDDALPTGAVLILQ